MGDPLTITQRIGRARQLADLLPLLSARQDDRCIYCEQITLPPPATATDAAALGLPAYPGALGFKTRRYRCATVEHVRRRAEGGSDDPRNLVMACAFCNSWRDEVEPLDHKRRMMALVGLGLHPCGPGYEPRNTPALRRAIEAGLARSECAAALAALDEAMPRLPPAVELALARASDAAFEVGAGLDAALEEHAARDAADRAAERALRLAILDAIGGGQHG